jgi:hypothetical protein
MGEYRRGLDLAVRDRPRKRAAIQLWIGDMSRIRPRRDHERSLILAIINAAAEVVRAQSPPPRIALRDPVANQCGLDDRDRGFGGGRAEEFELPRAELVEGGLDDG